MKRKLALAMVLAMTASMAQPVLAADSKTTLDVIISQYGTQTQAWWSQFEKDFEICIFIETDCSSRKKCSS